MTSLPAVSDLPIRASFGERWVVEVGAQPHRLDAAYAFYVAAVMKIAATQCVMMNTGEVPTEAVTSWGREQAATALRDLGESRTLENFQGQIDSAKEALP